MSLVIYSLGCVLAFILCIYVDLKISKVDVKLVGFIIYVFISLASWLLAGALFVFILIKIVRDNDFIIFKANKD